MFENVFEHKILTSNKDVYVLGLNKKVQASYVLDLFSVSKKSILIVTNTLYEANNLYKSFVFSDFKNNVFLFPMDDFVASEAVAISPDLMVKRIEVLNEISSDINKKMILVTNLMGYLRYLPSKSLWKSLKITLKKDDFIERDELINKLSKMGYKKESLVTKTGEYANRGYILDIFPYDYDNPVRIEFFDNQIEEIRNFNADDQLSLKKLNEVIILPFTEFINEKNIPEIPPRQSLLPRVLSEVSNISLYLDDFITVYIDIDQIRLGYKKILEEILEFKQTDNFNIEKYMFDLEEVCPKKYLNISSLNNFSSDNTVKEIYDSSQIECFKGNFNRLNDYIGSLIRKNKTIIACLNNDKVIGDFSNNINYKTIITDEFNINKDYINIINKNLQNGFILNDKVYLTNNEIYNESNKLKYKSKFRYGSKIRDINKLNIGDYIVHQTHGIGKYLGIVTLTSKGLKKDYIHLLYKDSDKLYVPVEKIEYISKYSSNEGVSPKLNKLGGSSWAKQKAAVKRKVKDIAQDLFNMSIKRKLVPGFPFLEDDEMQILFDKKFEYEETKDQLKVIKEIKKDMQSPYPMDRLLCGDVGYGKTEVAFRAIFKAIRSGKQVAFLCPTTILSKQHYNNALVRFDGFGVNIEVLNRFVTLKKKNEILKNIENGKVDLIIGTHMLLNKDIKYKDLGFLVIDEEQRFGVTHKEKIKQYKENIDVLTLSATPIPRTLQMSLSNVRGLSLIETPPAFRYPVQTYVLRENDQVIKDAIYKELARDGQVFILYNSVLKQEDQVIRIKKLVPEANIAFIHGKMSKQKIETTMEKFVSKEYNVLVCTTIIETGIDIENVNTLIVLDSDRFGLSQLYQIRGRIGRGKVVAYAYLMYEKNKELNDVAIKRLNAIKEFTELGSGYALAMRDLAIRGAGDVLGSEQSGFIDSVGYDMYLKILNEEVEKLKNNKTTGEEDIKDYSTETDSPFIQVSTHISDDYASTSDLKIEIHKKINTITSYNSFIKVKEELEDRFGKLNDDVIIYMQEELFQYIAPKKGIMKVEQLTDKIVIYFSLEKSKKINGVDLLANLFKINPNFEVSYLNKIIKITLKTKNLKKHFIYYLVKMLKVIE